MRTLVIATVVLAVASVASAGIVDEFALELQYYPDGSAYITNVSDTVGALTPGPWTIDLYEIWSSTSALRPGTDQPTAPDGWDSIYDHASSPFMGPRWTEAGTALGAGAYGFGEVTKNTGLLAEGTLGAGAVFAVQAPWHIGNNVFTTPVPAEGTIDFFYTKPGVVGDKFRGSVDLIPEPASLGLLSLGVLGLLRRRRS